MSHLDSTGPGTLWLRARSRRAVVAAHLRHVAGAFRAAGWEVAVEQPEPRGALAVLDDPWADPLPATASFLARRAAAAPGGWRVPRASGAAGAQDWPLQYGPFTLRDYEKTAARATRRPGRPTEPGPSPWLGFAVAAVGEAESLLAAGWPPAPGQVLIEPGALVYRYQDPAGHERRELDLFIPPEARILVDVGCGHGRLGERHRRPGRVVVGIEPEPALAGEAARRLDLVLPVDARRGLAALRPPLDCIVFADVLEHLEEPEAVLAKAARMLSSEGRVLVSLPNSSWAPVLRAAAAGRWDRTLAGVQARDHLVPMTPASFARMAAEAGLEVERRIPIEAPLLWGLRWWARLTAMTAGGTFRELAAPQWVMVLRPFNPRA